MKNPISSVSCLVAGLMATASTLSAATLEVASLADSGSGSLRAALELAAPGDTIRITAQGSLSLASSLKFYKPLTVEGPGSDKLKVRRGEGQTAKFGVLEVYNTGTLTLRGMTITDGDNNLQGGALYRKSVDELVIEDCLVIGNRSASHGGALAFTGGGTVTLRRCAIRGNRSEGSGGAIYHVGGKLNLWESSVDGNSSHDNGGALFLKSAAEADVRNSTISGNIGNRSGTIYLDTNTRMRMLSSTVAYNGQTGGIFQGIYNAGGKVEIGSSIVSGNIGQAPADYHGQVASLGFNLVGETSTSFFTASGDQVGIRDPKLQPLGYYGGRTLVHPPRLDSVSVVDRGNRALGGVTLDTDQPGKVRPVRAHWQEPVAGSDFSDTGAVELQESPQTAPSLVVNTTDDTDDGVAGELHCSLREAMRVANAVSDIPTTVRFHPAVFGPGKPPRVIDLAKELPEVMYRMSIEGPGAKFLSVRRASESRFGIFSIGERHASGTISGLTVANGYDYNGGGIYVFSSGELVLTNCHVTACRADFEGGGIFCKDGRVVIRGCTLSGNRSGRTAAACAHGFGESIIENSTFQGNIAVNGPGTITTAGTMSLTSCTIVDNYPSGIGGVGTNPALSARNCIITRNYKNDVDDKVVSGGFNLVRFGNKTFVNGVNGDQTDVLDPKLGPLKDNGGPTFTMAPLFGSRALDKGFSFGLSVDQRGFKRPFDLPALPAATGGDHADIGAFELGRMRYDEWCRQAFTDEQLAAAYAAPEGDANASGVPNTLKHLFGIDPLLPLDESALKALPKVIASAEEGRSLLTLTYRRSALYTGPQEVVETSTDLKEWAPAVLFRSSAVPSAIGSFASVVFVTVDVTGMREVYLRVSQPQ